MKHRVNPSYVDRYSTIVLTQPLSHDRYIEQVYMRNRKGWNITYNSNSAFHLCPFDGVFRECKSCGADEEDFDIHFCLDKKQTISSIELAERINDCLNANLKVKFLG